MLKVLLEALKESFKLLPFLFMTCLIIDLIQRAAGEKTNRLIQKGGKVGPLWGSLCGAFPQCGFSAAASYFYAKRVITVGTLISIYMSTSDEMLPVMVSEKVRPSMIGGIILTKIVIGAVSGFAMEIFLRRLGKKHRISGIQVSDQLNDTEHHHGLIADAALHSFRIWILIVLVSAGTGYVVYFIGRNNFSMIFSDIPVLGELAAGLVGFIPNCGASVVITQLYLNGIIGTGPMMSGLLVSAGVGLLVLFKENHDLRENFLIAAVLYFMSAAWGVLFDISGVNF